MGGKDYLKGSYLSSTETLQLGERAWRESTALPRPLFGLRAATLDNIIFVTGEMIMLMIWSYNVDNTRDLQLTVIT